MKIELPPTITANMEHFTGRTWILPTLLEWFEKSDKRVFILTGSPGTGKSMIMAWLAGLGPTPVQAEARQQLEQLRHWVKAVHLCVAASGNTDPKELARKMAGQLTQKVPGFDKALLATIREQFQIATEQRVDRVEKGGTVTGVYIANLNLSGLSEELSYNRILRDPLKRLYDDGYDLPMLLLVDALDEALTYSGGTNIVQLLAKLSHLPAKVRILAATRPEQRVLKYFREAERFDLIVNAPPDQDDIRLYVDERLALSTATIEHENRGLLAKRISEAAKGIFLYAYMVLGELLPRLPDIPDLATYPLPEGLGGLYNDFLIRELGRNEDRWYETFKPVIGLIAIAQGEGLTTTQIQQITGKEVEQTIRICRQYLAGDLPEGPFRVFHQSFADFLLEDPHNIDYHIDSPSMHLLILHYYQQLTGGWPAARWSEMDGYGWRHLLVHAEKAGSRHRGQFLFEICDAGFLEAKRQTVMSAAALEEDWARALRLCREVGDYARFIRYGLQRAHHFMDISPLLTTSVARLAAWLAVHRGSEAAVDRLSADIALIPHLHARLNAEQALLDELVAASITHPAVERLIRSLESELATLPSGEHRDSYLANYLSALARARHSGWRGAVGAPLEEVKSFFPRVSLLATLARAWAEDGDRETAFCFLNEALEQCQGVAEDDDFVASLLQGIGWAKGESPATILAAGLAEILMAAPSLAAQDCANIVAAAHLQFNRIMKQFDLSKAALYTLNLNRLAIGALGAAGLHDLNQELVREIMQPYLEMAPDSDATGLLALLPILTLWGGEHDREVWRQHFGRYLADVSSAVNLLWIAQTASDLSTFGVGAAEVNAVLELVENRAKSLSLGEVGFVITANLALGYSRTNSAVHARDLISDVLDQVSAQQLGPSQYPSRQ